MKIWIYTLLMTLCYSANSQWYPDRHSTSVKDTWLSCTTSANPNPARATSHWIRYDLGAIYTLSTSKFWNYNAPDNLNRGHTTSRHRLFNGRNYLAGFRYRNLPEGKCFRIL
ncbi:MAG: hypothetical protein IPM42_08575 [Saprospiraceae bacterium]|nr:hypothetical protein [Saprospiraceae bacterium]